MAQVKTTVLNNLRIKVGEQISPTYTVPAGTTSIFVTMTANNIPTGAQATVYGEVSQDGVNWKMKTVCVFSETDDSCDANLFAPPAFVRFRAVVTGSACFLSADVTVNN